MSQLKYMLLRVWGLVLHLNELNIHEISVTMCDTEFGICILAQKFVGSHPIVLLSDLHLYFINIKKRKW